MELVRHERARRRDTPARDRSVVRASCRPSARGRRWRSGPASGVALPELALPELTRRELTLPGMALPAVVLDVDVVALHPAVDLHPRLAQPAPDRRHVAAFLLEHLAELLLFGRLGARRGRPLGVVQDGLAHRIGKMLFP